MNLRLSVVARKVTDMMPMHCVYCSLIWISTQPESMRSAVIPRPNKNIKALNWIWGAVLVSKSEH